jgi:hypothetical protein
MEKIVNGLKIDPQIFTFKFSCKCTGECCYYGVYTDYEESRKILSIKDKIIPLMDESQPKDPDLWFEQPEEDDSFISGIAVGTELYNDKCVFLDAKGLCTLQKLALKENVDQWNYKPLYCILFPLTVYENTLTIDNEHIDRLKTCNNIPAVQISIYEACRGELLHYFGESGLAEIEDFRINYLKEIETGV